ncbi:MAG: peptidylprolyl isomerase [Flavobacteriaceae bacterium]|nr:peptidylprolyl isomerase [Flavobacteriaceae bacterium]
MKTYSGLCLALIFLLLFSNCDTKKASAETEIEERKTVEMITSYGTVTLELYNETPLHRDNFIKLINENAYDSLLFHRVIQNFMIQGGDPDSRKATADQVLGNGDLDYRVKAEFHPDLFHKRGALATARDESLGRESSAMQFFIVQGKVFNDSLLNHAESRINKFLARHYTINDSLYKELWLTMKTAIEDENLELYRQLNDSIDAMAETYDNFERYSIPESHRSVYKTIGGTPHLDQNYTVIGEVIDGMQIVDSIAGAQTNEMNRPISDIRILSVQLKDE